MRRITSVIARPISGSATAALRTLTCREPDMEALTAFYDSWMLEVRNRRG